MIFFKNRFFLILAFFIAVPVVMPVNAKSVIPAIVTEEMLYNSFPETFMFGTADSAYQIWGEKGLPESNWAAFEQKKDIFGNNPIQENQHSKDATGSLESTFDNIHLIKDLGCTGHRLSLDWSLIEPQEGVFNSDAIAFYHKLLDAMLAAGVEPNVTLHHFVHPQWFEEKGAFEYVKNIQYFTRFAVKVFGEYSSKVRLWVTINEPGVYAVGGYLRGVFPPAKYDSRLTGIVIHNLLAAHVDVYRTLKALPNGDKAQIGIIHQFLKSEPTPAAKPVLGSIAELFNQAFHFPIFNFLKTGVFDYNVQETFMSIFDRGYWVPAAHVYSDSLVKPGEKFFDFLGINYYSVVLVGLAGPTCNDGEYMTNMPYRAYPQGLYDAIKESSDLGVPLYVTENGISDVRDIHRAEWIKTHLFAVKQALDDGCDVRGFYYWSLLDNFEWDMGYHQHFGLYKVNFKTKERTLREGSKVYRRIIAHQAHA